MPERQSEKRALLPWRVPVAVEDVAETGERFELVADADIRAGLARIAGLRDLPRLHANFEVTRHGAEGVRVAGRVSAIVGQACVVTLEPLANEVDEEIDLLFLPPPAAELARGAPGAPDGNADQAEPLIDRSRRARHRIPYPRARSLSAQARRGVCAAAGRQARRRTVRRARRAEEGSRWPLIAVVSGRRTAIVPAALPPLVSEACQPACGKDHAYAKKSVARFDRVAADHGVGPRSFDVANGPHCSRRDGRRSRPGRGRRRRGAGVGAPPTE